MPPRARPAPFLILAILASSLTVILAPPALATPVATSNDRLAGGGGRDRCRGGKGRDRLTRCERGHR